ncbi:FAD-dependent oxidoreductase [Haliea sp. E17]|uniref:FAD-dependent oxidoreductase n=1 Tax=Haliea sp. E17 TaxID=3401576 RepID=UPI003AAEBEBF
MQDKVISIEAVPEFHDQCDLLVIGYGIAGACAALEAARAGGDVLVLERSSAGGGASALSSGIFYLGGGTAVQEACGFEDSADNMYRFMTASMGSEDAELVQRYCADNVAHFDWLETQGIPFERSYHKDKAVFLLTTEGLLSTGNEKVWPYREIARPVPRGHQVAQEGESPGSAAMEALIARCAEAGVRSACDTQVNALIRDGEGRICGVRARQQGQDRYFRADRGVVMATGGFSMNETMVRAHWPQYSETCEPLGGAYSDGSGIELGSAAGGRTEAMDGVIATASIYPPGQLIKGIVVNRNGHRFVAEDSYHGRLGGFIAEQPEQRAYLIVDAEIFAYPEIETARHQLVDGFETVEEMEQRLEMPAGALQTTMAEYNRHAREASDPQFQKHADWLKPLDQGPWAAFDISFDRSSYLFITLGGLKIDCEARVVDARGQVIPGLFAAGACTTHIPKSGKSYASGMSLGPGSYFGRVAGRCAMSG